MENRGSIHDSNGGTHADTETHSETARQPGAPHGVAVAAPRMGKSHSHLRRRVHARLPPGQVSVILDRYGAYRAPSWADNAVKWPWAVFRSALAYRLRPLSVVWRVLWPRF